MEHYYALNVFIASPNDVKAERKACFDVIKKLNHDWKDSYKVIFNEKSYERIRPTVIEPRHSLQEVVDSEIPAESIDVFICILGKRMGTPIKNQQTGEIEFESGTEKEFKTAYDLWKKSPHGNRSPFILLYHKVPKNYHPKGDEAEQYKKVQIFLERFRSYEEHPGRVQEFSTTMAFSRFLEKHLFDYMVDFSNKMKRVNDGDVNEIWSNFANKMYLQNDKNGQYNPTGKVHLSYKNVQLPVTAEREQRTQDKRAIMQNAMEIRMMAHAGQSYLDIFTDRMRGEVVNCLKRGGKVKIILTNPFSYSGLLISIADESENKAEMSVKSLLQKLAEDQTHEEVISIIEKSNWYSRKQAGALHGYQILKDQYPDGIQLKMLGFDMYATTLITNKGAFLEPYLIVSREERRGMSTFELQVQTESYIYNNVSENFEILWELAEPYESYTKHIELYKQNLRQDINMLIGWKKDE